MKLYELRVAELGIMRLRDTYYFTSEAAAMKKFNEHKNSASIVDLYRIDVMTKLKAVDWCALLAADAPGLECVLTPQKLITDRVLISTYQLEEEAA